MRKCLASGYLGQQTGGRLKREGKVCKEKRENRMTWAPMLNFVIFFLRFWELTPSKISFKNKQRKSALQQWPREYHLNRTSLQNSVSYKRLLFRLLQNWHVDGKWTHNSEAVGKTKSLTIFFQKEKDQSKRKAKIYSDSVPHNSVMN